jgi:tetratricopeptide (TPR) repeat protein
VCSSDLSETRFRYYYAKGILSQLSGHDAQAIDAWEQALCEETLDHRLWAAVACEITENALAQGSLDYASDLLKVVLSRTPWKITANLQFLRLSYLKHERSQADDTLLRLIKLAPTNPRIFSFLKASLLSDRLKNTQD